MHARAAAAPAATRQLRQRLGTAPGAAAAGGPGPAGGQRRQPAASQGGSLSAGLELSTPAGGAAAAAGRATSDLRCCRRCLNASSLPSLLHSSPSLQAAAGKVDLASLTPEQRQARKERIAAKRAKREAEQAAAAAAGEEQQQEQPRAQAPQQAAAAAAAQQATAAAPAKQQAAAPAPAAAPAVAAPRQQQQQQYLYEPRYGLPVVRRRLGYSELLRAMRAGEVAEVRFFTADADQTAMEGPCLVVLTDGTVAQAHIPDDDWRCAGCLAAGLRLRCVPVGAAVGACWCAWRGRVAGTAGRRRRPQPVLAGYALLPRQAALCHGEPAPCLPA